VRDADITKISFARHELRQLVSGSPGSTIDIDDPIISCSALTEALSLWQDDTPIVRFVPRFFVRLSLDGEALVLHPGDRPYASRRVDRWSCRRSR
jgi:hypothetical protein